MEQIYRRDKTTSSYSTRKNSSATQKIVIENVEKMLTKHMVSNSAVSHKKQRWRPFNAIHVSVYKDAFIH